VTSTPRVRSIHWRSVSRVPSATIVNTVTLAVASVHKLR
jgi:hypothetical protein